MLTTQSAAPNALLEPFIYCYVQRDMVSSEEEMIEPVLPRAGPMLEFQFAALYEVKAFETDRLRPSWATTVIGPIDSRRVRLILRDEVKSLVVLFRPLGLYRLFGVPMAPLTGAGTEGHAVLGTHVSRLYERLGNALNFVDRVKLLDRFFIDRLNRSRPLDPTGHAIRLLTAGQCNVGAAAKMIGMSERQLERRSLDCAGVSPRTIARISRFQRAIGKYRSGFGNWMDVAHEVGYCDQMHLVKNFHDLGGGAPTEVIKGIAENHLISFCCR